MWSVNHRARDPAQVSPACPLLLFPLTKMLTQEPGTQSSGRVAVKTPDGPSVRRLPLGSAIPRGVGVRASCWEKLS